MYYPLELKVGKSYSALAFAKKTIVIDEATTISLRWNKRQRKKQEKKAVLALLPITRGLRNKF